jgi:hypothetical protein
MVGRMRGDYSVLRSDSNFCRASYFYDKKCHFIISESLCYTKQSVGIVTIFVNFANQGKIRYIGRAVLMSKKINK